MASTVDLRRLRGFKGRNLLHLAVEGSCVTGRLDVCRFLVEEKGFDANSTSTEGETPIFVATDTDSRLLNGAENGVVPLLTYFLGRGGDPAAPDAKGCTPCTMPRSTAGADVNFHSSPGPTMLLAAVGAGSADVVNFLLEIGADPNVHDGYGKFPIILAAAHERRKLVEILLPQTNPIPSMPDWTVDGIVNTMKNLPREMVLEPIANAKSQGKEAFANGDYGNAVDCYTRATVIDPRDATSFANLSLCLLKLREGERAVLAAQQCQKLRPCWAKAWYHEGAGLSLLQKYGAAVAAFEEALKLDPANDEIKEALRTVRSRRR
ncbi:unnamed protein product [Miscanthus lutarioriparius]|uniref:Uncharacterized protein n=1 Tax=Miscanthus lutarioriparius TaxID=422564 RepID=A0A811RAD1_9POAL|nr:unnamed protein product [Miscanthus lutarioriparius]